MICPASSLPSPNRIGAKSLRTRCELAHRADHRGVVLALETGNEPAANLTRINAHKIETLAASLDPASFLRIGIDPVVAAHQLGPWVATLISPIPPVLLVRRTSFIPAVADFPPACSIGNRIGRLEEIQYRGFLAV